MRRRIALCGITDDALRILPRLATQPGVELACVFDAKAAELRRRLALLDPSSAAILQRLLSDDPTRLEGLECLDAAEAAALCGGADTASATDPRRDLLHALGEVADAADLVSDAVGLAERLLGVAASATGAPAGSLLLVNDARDALVPAAAIGLERELWPKVRLALGDGVAGRAWAEGRPLVLVGRADPAHFAIAHERHDVASALVMPLVAAGVTHGVLSLHHPTRSDCFGRDDLAFAETLGAVGGRILARAQDVRRARAAAERAAAEHAVATALDGTGPPEVRLAALCRCVAEQLGGVCTVWWRDDAGDGEGLRLAATSLPGGAFGAPLELVPGEGIDGRAARDRTPQLVRQGAALAYAALPLLDAGVLLGVLSLQAGARAPDAARAEPLLVAMAQTAASRLGDSERGARERERSARSDAVHEAALRVLTANDARSIAEQLAAAGSLALGAEHVVVRLRDAERRTFPIRARSGATDPLGEGIATDRSAAREALRRGATVDSGAGAERAWLVVPLLHRGERLGTIGLYGKRPPAPPRFDAVDRALAERLAAFASHAVAHCAAPATDADSGAAESSLVDGDAFRRSLDREIARASAAGDGRIAFVLLTCRVENARSLGEAATARAIDRIARALVLQLRPFDAAARIAPDAIAALLPEPGAQPSERIARLARAVAETAGKEDGEPHADLVFGHAIHPDDAGGPAALLARASAPRLRML